MSLLRVFALFVMATTYLDAGGYAADGRWMGTERDGWKKAKERKTAKKRQGYKMDKNDTENDEMQDKISECDVAGTAGAAQQVCKTHFPWWEYDKQISPDFFTYAEHVGKLNILNSPDLQPDVFLQIILAVIAV